MVKILSHINPIEYEGLQKICFNCSTYGHKACYCPRKIRSDEGKFEATHRSTTNYKGCFQSSEGIGTSAAHAEVKGSRWLDIVTMFLVANWMVRGFAPLIFLEDLYLSPFQALVNIGSFLYTYHEALRLPK